MGVEQAPDPGTTFLPLPRARHDQFWVPGRGGIATGPNVIDACWTTLCLPSIRTQDGFLVLEQEGWGVVLEKELKEAMAKFANLKVLMLAPQGVIPYEAIEHYHLTRSLKCTLTLTVSHAKGPFEFHNLSRRSIANIEHILTLMKDVPRT